MWVGQQDGTRVDPVIRRGASRISSLEVTASQPHPIRRDAPSPPAPRTFMDSPAPLAEVSFKGAASDLLARRRMSRSGSP